MERTVVMNRILLAIAVIGAVVFAVVLWPRAAAVPDSAPAKHDDANRELPAAPVMCDAVAAVIRVEPRIDDVLPIGSSMRSAGEIPA
jgi:hypothetical protein